MADAESSSASSFLSPNTLLAVITLVGGIFLVSHNLSSDRPRRLANEGTRPLGYQNVESRLWEDPFAAWNKLSKDNDQECNAAGLANLASVLRSEIPDSAPQKLLILGVMLPGGPYAEDTENRVRCRYAIGAALGVGGYKPAEAGHIGLVSTSWPATDALELWKTNTNSTLDSLVSTGGSAPVCHAGKLPDVTLRVSFEQYDLREFHPQEGERSGKIPAYGRVLVHWLDEDYFSDEPAARMALFFHQLRQLVPQLTNGACVDNAIIGPRTSDTLRRLLKSAPKLLGDLRPWLEITQTLNSVRLILATPTAMDEVLVSSDDVPLHKFNEPRAAVACALAGKIFRSVTNFACTDTLIASEAIDELKLRGIDPVSHTNQHIVLLSEWDTFFSRVSGIAFAAELTKRLTNSPKGCAGARRFPMRFSL